MTDTEFILDTLLIIFSGISVVSMFLLICIVKWYQDKIEYLEKQLDKWRL